jgi:drug/metabolite transporter (DMT)-like permease
MARWLFWLLVTLLSWGIWAILSRLIGNAIHPAHSQAMSTVGLLPIVLASWMMKQPHVTGNYNRGVWMAFGSGLVSASGNIVYYAALNNAKAATIVPLTALYPAVTILLAVPLLKERITPLQWAGMGSSLAAIYLFNAPDPERAASAWMLFALAPIVLWGIALLMQKTSTDYIPGGASALWFLIAFLPMAALILVWKPLPSGIPMQTWGLEAALGFALGFGNLTILLAFASGGRASVIAPLSGLYPLVSIPIAIVAFGERLSQREAFGIALALAAVVMLSYQAEPKAAGSPTHGPDRT